MRLPRLSELGRFIPTSSPWHRKVETIVSEHVVFWIQKRFVAAGHVAVAQYIADQSGATCVVTRRDNFGLCVHRQNENAVRYAAEASGQPSAFQFGYVLQGSTHHVVGEELRKHLAVQFGWSVVVRRELGELFVYSSDPAPLDVEGGLDLDGRSIVTFAPIEVWSMLDPPALRPPPTPAWSPLSGKNPHYNVYGEEYKGWVPPKSKASPSTKPSDKGSKGKGDKGDKGKGKHEPNPPQGKAATAKGTNLPTPAKGGKGKGIYVPAKTSSAAQDKTSQPQTKSQKRESSSHHVVDEEDVLRAALEQLAVEEGIDVNALLNFNRQKLTRSAKRSRSVSRDPTAGPSSGSIPPASNTASTAWADGFMPDFGNSGDADEDE
jgi:hypothetical protein